MNLDPPPELKAADAQTVEDLLRDPAWVRSIAEAALASIPEDIEIADALAKAAAAETERVGQDAVDASRTAYKQAIAPIEHEVKERLTRHDSRLDVARWAAAERREMSLKHKSVSDKRWLVLILARNVSVYGDGLGPTFEHLRRTKTLGQILGTAAKSGGQDIGLRAPDRE